MKLITCILLLLCCDVALAQSSDRRVLFVIDSIPQLRDPAEWDKIMTEDVADMTVIRNKDSLKMLGWGQMEAITFIFTKAYRKRPDSIKRIPSLKQMELKDGSWHWRGQIYSGKYIDYYMNGSLLGEGELANGKLNGHLVIYSRNGNKISDTEFENGHEHGWKYLYYQNGALMSSMKYVSGRYIHQGKMYFINGNVQQETRLAKRTRYDTLVRYYSNGQIRKMNLIINGEVIRKDKEEKMMYYTSLFLGALNKGEIKNANKNFYQIWLLDSADVETKYNEGLLLMKESRYDEAIARFDQALKIEPFMREAIFNRGIARLKKYQPTRIASYTKPGTEIPYSVDDFLSMPETERDKICNDLQRAREMNFGNVLTPGFRAVINHCGIK